MKQEKLHALILDGLERNLMIYDAYISHNRVSKHLFSLLKHEAAYRHIDVKYLCMGFRASVEFRTWGGLEEPDWDAFDLWGARVIWVDGLHDYIYDFSDEPYNKSRALGYLKFYFEAGGGLPPGKKHLVLGLDESQTKCVLGSY